MTEPRFPIVLVDVLASDADEASGELFELGATGVEERDATTLAKGTAGKVTLVASFGDPLLARAAARGIRADWSPRFDEIVGDAWRDDWKKYFHPFAICPGVVIRPPWEERSREAGERVLVLEPGRAFGTGLHETTSLVAEALAEHVSDFAGGTVLDVGCGSGILALVALSLGARFARGVDVDADAVAVTRENAARNALAERVSADTTDVALLDEAFDVVVANIEARVLVPMAKDLVPRVKPGKLLVLSGILAPKVSTQSEEVRAAYASFELVASRERGEWTALVLRAPGGASVARPPRGAG